MSVKPNRLVICAVVSLLVALVPASAEAFAAKSPTNGERTTSTPGFRWELGFTETADTIEISPSPRVLEAGDFVAHRDQRRGLLYPSEQTYFIARDQSLGAGTWYWHVLYGRVNGPYEGTWSAVESFRVVDAPIRIASLEAHYLPCARKLQVKFSYRDNSRSQKLRGRLGFLDARGRRLAAADFTTRQTRGPGTESGSKTVAVPRDLPRGRSYGLRLALVDNGGHRSRSKVDSIRLARCLGPTRVE